MITPRKMITGVTLRDTSHGNPGEHRILFANTLVELRPIKNLPSGSEIAFWAHPLKRHPWLEDTAQWAKDVGVKLGSNDVVLAAE